MHCPFLILFILPIHVNFLFFSVPHWPRVFFSEAMILTNYHTLTESALKIFSSNAA